MNRCVGTCLLLTLLFAESAASQAEANLTQEMIDAGKTEFERYKFYTADSIANEALRIATLRRVHKLQVLQLAAASRYPSDTKHQFADSALVALRELVRIAPGSSLRKEYYWPGLDSLHSLARRTTFGASAAVPDTALVEGTLGTVRFDVVASRPAIFYVSLSHADASGRVVRVDSGGPFERGSVGFVPVGGDQPVWGSGRYRMTVVAVDPASGERIELAYRAAFETPPVQLMPLEAAWNRSGTVPEYTRPARKRSIVSGLAVGGFVYATTNLLRPTQHRDANVEANTSSTAWAVGLGALTTGVSWYLDRGRPILPNINYNKTLAENFRRHQSTLATSNEEARIAYTARIRFTPEDL